MFGFDLVQQLAQIFIGDRNCGYPCLLSHSARQCVAPRRDLPVLYLVKGAFIGNPLGGVWGIVCRLNNEIRLVFLS